MSSPLNEDGWTKFIWVRFKISLSLYLFIHVSQCKHIVWNLLELISISEVHISFSIMKQFESERSIIMKLFVLETKISINRIFFVNKCSNHKWIKLSIYHTWEASSLSFLSYMSHNFKPISIEMNINCT